VRALGFGDLGPGPLSHPTDDVGAGLFLQTRRAALITGVGVAILVGIVGQDLGGLLSGQASDPGSGAPLVLLALAVSVITRAIDPGVSPGWTVAAGASLSRNEADDEGGQDDCPQRAAPGVDAPNHLVDGPPR
jgi:hypothetical protein